MKRIVDVLLAGVLVMGLPAVVRAQAPEQKSFEELQAAGVLKPGMAVTVETNAGRLKGWIGDVSGRTLRVENTHGSRIIDQATVRRIERRDSVARGTLSGLGIGLGAMFVIDRALCTQDPECSTYAALYVGLPVLGGSVVAGALIGRSLSKTVYTAPDGRLTVSVSPTVSAKQQGGMLAVAF
jgi:hypothetical protein